MSAPDYGSQKGKARMSSHAESMALDRFVAAVVADVAIAVGVVMLVGLPATLLVCVLAVLAGTIAGLLVLRA